MMAMSEKKQPPLSGYLPYGRQWIGEEEIEAVRAVLLSDWLTTGPAVAEFEQAVARKAGVACAAAVSSGTAALHAAMDAVGIGAGDEVIVPPITFAATANAVVYQGGVPVFADVEPDTLLIDPEKIENRITGKTRAIAAVDYAGQMCDYDRLRAVADKYGLALIADACHSIGAHYHGAPSGSCADLSVFSFHPVKHITTGEGGMVVSNDRALIQRVRQFRNHGIKQDLHQRGRTDSWVYEIEEIGYNYRLTDFQCALGLVQMNRLDEWIDKRNDLAGEYDRFFAAVDGVSPLHTRAHSRHAYHIYVVRLDTDRVGKIRSRVFASMRDQGIGVNVHYIPVYYHPFYQKRFGYGQGLCPEAERAYEEMITLPLFPRMTSGDVRRVCESLTAALRQ